MTQSKSDHSFFSGFSKMVDEVFGKDFFDWSTHVGPNFGVYLPAANIKETAENYLLEMMAPGREKADFTIQYTDNKLVVNVSKKEIPALAEGERYTKKEFAYPGFRRQFHFPKNAVEEKLIKARYENGILIVRLPKKAETERDAGHTISVD